MKNVKGLLTCLLLICLPGLSSAADKFFCSGNKPVWNLSLGSDKILFKKTDFAPVVVPGVTAQPAENKTIENARVYRSKTTEHKVIAIIKKGDCTDGNKRYRYGALTLVDNNIYHGCCIKR